MQQLKSFRRVRAITFFILVVFALTIAVLLRYSFVHERDSSRSDLRVGSDIVTAVMEQQLRETAAALANLERLDREYTVGSLDFPGLQNQLASTKSLVSGVSNLVLLDADGKVIGSTADNLINGNFAFRYYFQEAIQAPVGQFILSPPFRSSLRNTRRFTLSRAIHTADGSVQGVAVASFDTSLLTQLIELQLNRDRGQGISLALAHADGEPILRVPEQEGFYDEILNRPRSPFATHLASGREETQTEGKPHEQSPTALLNLRTIAPEGLNISAPLVVVSAYPKSNAYSDWRLITSITIAAYLLLAGGIVFLLRNERDHLIQERDIRLKLQTQSSRLASIIEGTNVGTWEWNVQSGEVVFNERWAEIIGYSLEELEPASIETWMKYAHPDDLETSSQLLHKHFSGELPYYECEARMQHKDGHWIWVLDRGKVASWTNDGKPLWMFGTHQEITERKLAEEQASHLAYFDSLTNLPNRRLLDDRLEHALAQAQRNGRTLALMFIDLDNFKPVNDTWGHQAGDQLLIEVSRRLKQNVRASDTVARTGGDEFILLLPEIADTADAEIVAQKILLELRKPIELHEGIQATTPPSIGISVCVSGLTDGATLMKQADLAMYAAKHAGRNCYRIYEPNLTAKALKETPLSNEQS
ncbi:sensor domain-containing diguanylate cyclase [Marinobacterium lutimaris]|uniref:PAS domain S-box-containing protein/diguanylate cyclase (GGDEF) domain-containing protein n=1 Tax=Marinobacterium lutimaris TaxID=568106 RepID=A0A1H5ZFD7_9GAMM|nr:diguanylate cyclase [Marinobacterium lutimaris]SEG34800.1 PAS domain S-box-containing protein/diguanylate cyclase (GGDEF) domain-containing protein [Marinobacterium lutimaris]